MRGTAIDTGAGHDGSTRVAVVEDIAVTLAGLRVELEQAGFEVVGFSDAASCQARLEGQGVDLVVVDLYLDGESGPPAITAVERLVSAGHAVVVYSTWALDPDVLAVVECGARAYVQKGPSSGPLVDVLRRVQRMEPGAGPVITPELAAAARRRERFGLTPSELEVLTYVSQHLTNAEIARLRSVTEETVKSQLASIRGKLGATSRAAAVRTAHRHGLIGRWKRQEP